MPIPAKLDTLAISFYILVQLQMWVIQDCHNIQHKEKPQPFEAVLLELVIVVPVEIYDAHIWVFVHLWSIFSSNICSGDHD